MNLFEYLKLLLAFFGIAETQKKCPDGFIGQQCEIGN